MSDIRVDNIKNEAGTGSPLFPHGANVTGVVTATTFDGNVTGDITGNVTGNVSGSSGSCTGNSNTATSAQGLSGTPNITVGVVNATSGSVSGNFSVGGVLTYEDTTNVDSVGLITARSGLQVLAGVTSMTGGVRFNGGGSLREKVKVTAGKLSDNLNIDLADGMIHLFTTAETATSTPNIRVNASTSLNSELAVGEQISVSVITTAAAAAFSANWTIDGAAVTEVWNGAAAPAAGGASGKDYYTLNIIKTSATPDYTVLANVSNFA